METAWRGDPQFFDDESYHGSGGGGRDHRGSRSSPKRRLKPIKAPRSRLGRSSSEDTLRNKHQHHDYNHNDTYASSAAYARVSHTGGNSNEEHLPTSHGHHAYAHASRHEFLPQSQPAPTRHAAALPPTHDIFEAPHGGHTRQARSKRSHTPGVAAIVGSHGHGLAMSSPMKKRGGGGVRSHSRNAPGARKLHMSQSTSHLIGGRGSPGGRVHTKASTHDSRMDVWDMESLKEEVINLKARLKGLRTENVNLAAHKQRLEVASQRKDKQLETVVTAAIDESGGMSRPSRQRHGTGALLEVIRSEKAAHLALQRKQREEARELKAARAELSEVRESLKFTHIKEIQLKSQVFYDEALRCQRLMAEQQQEHSARVHEMRAEHARKLARTREKIGTLQNELSEERDLVKKLTRDVLEANDAVKMLTVRLETVEETQETNRKRMQNYQRKLRIANYAQGPSSPVRGLRKPSAGASATTYQQHSASGGSGHHRSHQAVSSPHAHSHRNQSTRRSVSSPSSNACEDDDGDRLHDGGDRPLSRSKSQANLRTATFRSSSSRSRVSSSRQQQPKQPHEQPAQAAKSSSTHSSSGGSKHEERSASRLQRRSQRGNEAASDNGDLFTPVSRDNVGGGGGDTLSANEFEMCGDGDTVNATEEEEIRAALTIQRVQRGRVARRRVSQLRQERRSSGGAGGGGAGGGGAGGGGAGSSRRSRSNAEVAEAQTTRPSSAPLREQESAALVLQRVQRGRVARRQVRALRERRASRTCDVISSEADEDMESAAMTVQRVQRGRIARRQVRALREHRESGSCDGLRNETDQDLDSSKLNGVGTKALSSSGVAVATEVGESRKVVPKLSLDKVDATSAGSAAAAAAGDAAENGYSSDYSEDSYESEFAAPEAEATATEDDNA